MPFLLHAPTIGTVLPLIVAVNRVGDPPKSPSPTILALGTWNEASSLSAGLSLRIATVL